jgi:formylglycine-generating enzyme required for sulfatase activity
MIGNVWEWTGDCWNGSYSGAPTDGSAWTSGECGRRVLRGASWSSRPGLARAADRYGVTSGKRSDNGGFRLARTHF